MIDKIVGAFVGGLVLETSFLLALLLLYVGFHLFQAAGEFLRRRFQFVQLIGDAALLRDKIRHAYESLKKLKIAHGSSSREKSGVATPIVPRGGAPLSKRPRGIF